MEGQHLGRLRSSDGRDLGFVCLLLDPGELVGQLVSRGLDFDPPGPRVARVEKFPLGAGKFELRVRADSNLENLYRIEPTHRIADDFKITASVGADDRGEFQGEWRSSDGEEGQVQFIRLKATGAGLDAVETFSDWAEFKVWADRYVNSGCAFRGQSTQHQLSSSFHRTGRVDLIRYLSSDIPNFIDYLETLTGRVYDQQKPGDLGAVLALAQHHGFPTPLLDWTFSPYVAAYFAFAQVVEWPEPPDFVRIYRLGAKTVSAGIAMPVLNALDTGLVVSAYKPSSKGNARLLNQQGLFTFSNLVNIESFLAYTGEESSADLEVVEISGSVARRAISDLRNMGTTAETLFPGLDGASQYLKHLHFYR